MRTKPLAGKALLHRLRELLKENCTIEGGIENGKEGKRLITDKEIDDISLDELENIKAKILAVCPEPSTSESKRKRTESTSQEDQEEMRRFHGMKEAQIHLKDKCLIIPGWIRQKVPEILFEGDEDGDDIATAILESIRSVSQSTETIPNSDYTYILIFFMKCSNFSFLYCFCFPLH